jgi:heme/copper-type cytochrome/quinol oxidase subunit 4
MAWLFFIFVLIITIIVMRTSLLWVYYEGEHK